MSGPTHSIEGLPLDPTRSCVTPSSTDARNSGPVRRIDCQAPKSQLIAAPPSTRTPKSRSAEDDTPPRDTPPQNAPSTTALRVGPCDASLLDDDDELLDHFGGTRDAPAVGQDDPAPPAGAPWPVRERDVRAVPAFCQLERSAVFVSNASASAVSARIAAVLQDRSIAASYDVRNAKADCVSEGRVEFRVRLYRGRGGGCRRGIIVEVQRRAGFALSYMQNVYAILDAAEDKGPE